MTEARPDVVARGLLGALIASLLCLGTGPCKGWINDPVKLPTPGPDATPFGPTPPPVATPTPDPCPRLEGETVCHEKPEGSTVGSEMDDAVNAAIDAAFAHYGADPNPLGGPPRPGTGRAWVWLVGSHLQGQGLCVTYDYEHGELFEDGKPGRASEMSIRRRDGTRLFNYQIETSAARVRRPKGAYRGYCDNGGEGQPLQEAK